MNIGSHKYSTFVSDVDKISPSDLSILIDNINKNKILFISTLDTFDKFTIKYCYTKEDALLIKWKKVAKDFRGIGISEDLKEDRYLLAPYKSNTYASWWEGEFHCKNFCIFVKEEKNSKKSDQPNSKSVNLLKPKYDKYLAPGSPKKNNYTESSQSGESSQSAESVASTASVSVDSSRSTESFKSVESGKTGKAERKLLAPISPKHKQTENMPNKPVFKKPINADFSDDSSSENKEPQLKCYIHVEGEEDNNKFYADRPSAAASRAYSILLKRFEGRSIPNDIMINMRESHKKASTPAKIYTFKCNKERLEKPQEITVRDEKTGQMKKGLCYSRNKIKLVEERYE